MNDTQTKSSTATNNPFNFSHTFSALKHRGYRLIWVGSFLSNIGTWVQKIAQPWLILQLSGSPFLLGLDGFLQDAPLLMFLLIGGVVVDRLDKRIILIFSQLVQLSAALTIAILVLCQEISVGVILSLSFVVGCVQAFSTPAYLSFIPSLIDKSSLANAVALNSMQFNLSRLIGPAIGGILLASVGAAWCFGLNAFSFLAMLFVLLSLSSPTPSKTAVYPHSFVAEIREGFIAVFSRHDLVTVITIIFGISFFGAPLLIFIPVVAKNVLGVGAEGFSFMFAMFGLGAVIGAVLVSSLKSKWVHPNTMFITSSLLALCIFVFALSSNFYFSIAMLFGAGFVFVSSNVVGNTILQTTVSDELRGRAVSIYALAFRGGAPLGSLITGYIVETYDVQLALSLNAIGLFLMIFIARYRLIRR